MATKMKARPNGRPPFVPTALQRRRVSIAAGGGMRHEDIAIALGISRPTLQKYFEAELSMGALAKRMEVVEAMHAAAKRGSSSAAKAYLQIEAQLAAPPVPVGDALPAAAAPPRPVRLGKKEALNAAAVTAQDGTGWEGLLPDSAAPLQ